MQELVDRAGAAARELLRPLRVQFCPEGHKMAEMVSAMTGETRQICLKCNQERNQE